MTDPIQTCQIWGASYRATGTHDYDANTVVVEHSGRTDGGYTFNRGITPWLRQLDEREKVRLTTWLIDQRSQGDLRPNITRGIVDRVKSSPPLPAHIRARRLLRFLVAQMQSLSGDVKLDENTHSAYAHSASVDYTDVLYLLDHLREDGCILHTKVMEAQGLVQRVKITMRGYNKVEEEETASDPYRAFVAMWFDASMTNIFTDGLEPGIRDAGYVPYIINEDEHIDKIEDRVIAEIRRSRFVVADFTHGEEGARGSVYYEAGFAHGLNLPVIFTCSQNSFDSLHFDTSHYNHIVWKDPLDLRERLRSRIGHVIGYGPGTQWDGHGV